MLGIDVSHWNGKIDWNKTKQSGVEFAIFKVSQYKTKDSKFDTYYDECNVPCGAYIYNKVKNVAEAKIEAEFAVKALGGKSMPCGVWLDMEDKSMRNLGKNALSEIIKVEADILRAYGYTVGIYCNLDWYKNVLDSANLYKEFPFWIARYPKNDDGIYNPLLSVQKEKGCVMHQYSSKGKVSGIGGNVDKNYAYSDIVQVMDHKPEKKSVNPYPIPTYTLYRRRPLQNKKYVCWLQWYLNQLGYYDTMNAKNVDGSWGNLTDRALYNFQLAHRETYNGSIPDLRVGKNTRSALINAL